MTYYVSSGTLNLTKPKPSGVLSKIHPKFIPSYEVKISEAYPPKIFLSQFMKVIFHLPKLSESDHTASFKLVNSQWIIQVQF